MRSVLGVSALFHDSTACIVDQNSILAAAQEERFTRLKGDHTFPKNSIDYCMRMLPSGSSIDAIAYYENPQTKMARILENARAQFPTGAPIWKQSLRTISELNQTLPQHLLGIVENPDKIFFVGHHRSHAASAFYPSQYTDAAVLVVDGVGEWSTTTMWKGSGNTLTPIKEIKFPHSIGLLYSAFTQYCGFKVNSGEYKMMGLAPFGDPKFVNKILDEMIDLKPDGAFRLNLKYFNFHRGLDSISPLFGMLFGQRKRDPDEPISRHFMDIAASIQAVTNLIMASLAEEALKSAETNNLCMAGGVALNCVANSFITNTVPNLENLWIQPAAGDAGGALGAALVVQNRLTGHIPMSPRFPMRGSYLGPNYTDADIEAALKRSELNYNKIESETDLLDSLVSHLQSGKIMGHFDGRMEFGPRALGNRSILADPRPKDMLNRVNLGTKFREGWRPFAPMILASETETYFESPTSSDYMLLTSSLKKEYRDGKPLDILRSEGVDTLVDLQSSSTSAFSAVTHVDFTSRLQTVSAQSETRMFQLLTKFHEATGCPLLLNTSFNVRGEPIVCSPDDAIACFMNMNMDVLAIGNFVVTKEGQPAWVKSKVGKKKFNAD